MSEEQYKNKVKKVKPPFRPVFAVGDIFVDLYGTTWIIIKIDMNKCRIGCNILRVPERENSYWLHKLWLTKYPYRIHEFEEDLNRINKKIQR